MKLNYSCIIGIGLIGIGLSACSSSSSSSSGTKPGSPADLLQTSTPIKHVVVVFQENVSFDHYFGTYPNALNPVGEPTFMPAASTPAVNGLSASLLISNPNSLNSQNGTGPNNPFRLDRSYSSAFTADQNHAYPAEQGAFDNGKMDLFPWFTGSSSSASGFVPSHEVMGYYDGNTVTALWNYAQHYAMSDNSWGTTFGPSTVGALNLVSGNTNGAVPMPGSTAATDGTYDEYSDANGNLAATLVPDGQGGFTAVDDDDPVGDVCSSSSGFTFSMTGTNIGDLLNAKNISWGWFQGGFDLTASNINGTTGCSRSSLSVVSGLSSKDYVPHHEAFQYYKSTQNLNHTRPSSVSVIGGNNDGGANHQYDLNDFYSVLSANNLPAVSFIKAPRIGQGHAGYSDPLDEQQFLVTVVNKVMQSADWNSTAIIILYDDSDGWYDHAYNKANIVNGSDLSTVGLVHYDRLGDCVVKGAQLTNAAGKNVQGRCGYGTRQPFLVISPYAGTNYVDHTLIDQSSVIRFVEDNWLGGQRIPGSFDAVAGSIGGMFNFSQVPNVQPFLLDSSTGESL